MKEFYYRMLHDKLEMMCIFATMKDVNIRFRNVIICRLNKYEVQDLLELWNDEAKKKWPITTRNGNKN